MSSKSALLNLAVNARDAMANGGRLTIETSNAYLDEDYVTKRGAEIPPGQYVLVALSDTGAGMSREVAEQAFEPFFTTKPKGIGTGLGLSMVYGFVKQSGGHVKIYSEIGQGTTIKMYFPRVIEPRETVSAPAGGAKAEPAPRAGSQETILLVEDDDTVNRFALEVLQDLGYTVLTATDAPQALMLIDHHAIDLLFTRRGAAGRYERPQPRGDCGQEKAEPQGAVCDWLYAQCYHSSRPPRSRCRGADEAIYL